MAGIFATAQPEYARLNIATFPVDTTTENKRPLVAHYNRIGLTSSQQLRLRFADAPGIAAMAGARNRLTVIDIDERGAAGERLLADVHRQFGASRVVVRTGSGGFHAYYRHAGEGRKIRPDPRQPIDLIGGGPIILPPTKGFRGNYEIVHGHVDDLAALTPIRQVVATPSSGQFIDIETAQVGERDKKFWPYDKRFAHQASSFDELLSKARELNEMMPIPLPDSEVVAKCKYWWEKTQRGENRWGTGQFTTVDHSLIDNLMMRDPDAFMLLMFLRRNHWGRDFSLANEAHTSMPDGGWRRQRFTAARSRLIEAGYLIVISPARFKPNKAMVCRLAQGKG